jgi:hypothetical protein
MVFRVGWCHTGLGYISPLSCPQVFKIKSWETYFSLDAHTDFSVSNLKNLDSCKLPNSSKIVTVGNTNMNQLHNKPSLSLSLSVFGEKGCSLSICFLSTMIYEHSSLKND